MTAAVRDAHVLLAIASLRNGDYRTVDAVLAALARRPSLQISRRG